MFFSSKKSFRGIIAAAVCLCAMTVSAFASDIAAIAPVSAPAAEGTVLSAQQVDTAAQAQAESEAERAAAAQAAAEAARRALLTYQPVYGGMVRFSTAKSASEVITFNGRALGNYKLTFYCPCEQCSGHWGGSTSSGARATEGRTIAVDPRKIPIGSRVFIEGYGDFIAEDVGGAIKGNRIDVFVNAHGRAQQLGVQHANVYIMN